MMQKKDINITVELDKDHIPTNIRWQADDMSQNMWQIAVRCYYRCGMPEIKIL